MRLNACELEIDLVCRGLRLPSEVILRSGRALSRTRAALSRGRSSRESNRSRRRSRASSGSLPRASSRPCVSSARRSAPTWKTGPPPRYDDLRQVMLAMYEAGRRHRIPIGVAPNVEVSLVVTPADAALLAPRRADFAATRSGAGCSERRRGRPLPRVCAPVRARLHCDARRVRALGRYLWLTAREF